MKALVLISTLLAMIVVSCGSPDKSPSIPADSSKSQSNQSPLKPSFIASAVPVASPSSEADSLENSSSSNVGRKMSKTCQGFSFEKVIADESNFIEIRRSGIVVQSVKLPTGIDVNGFSADRVEKTREGFRFSIEYGSRYYFDKTFFFKCRENKFYLTRIKVTEFDKYDPDPTWKESTSKPKRRIDLDAFDVYDYITRADGSRIIERKQ